MKQLVNAESGYVQARRQKNTTSNIFKRLTLR